jgi:Ca-activated chloride channel homolog
MQADFLLDYDVVTLKRDQKLYLMARLFAGPAPENFTRRPLNLSLSLDRSGSMAGNKIDYTRQAAQLLVQNMGPDDTFSIVLYNESIETLLPPQHVQHKDMINQRIGQIKAGGTTNLSAGLLESANHVNANLKPEQVNRVIIMSDGLANRGVTATPRLVQIAAQKYAEGISITTMGLGEDFNEDLLMAIADAGGGAFYFIESPEVTPSIFQEELKGLLKVVGQNLVITVGKTPHVIKYQQLNAFPEEERSTGTAYRMGDILGDEIKTLLVELDVAALQDEGEITIVHLHFEYDELRNGIPVRQQMKREVRVNVSETAIENAGSNAEVQQSVLLLQAAQARRDAVRLADQGRYDDASALLNTAAQQIEAAALDDGALNEEKSALRQQARDMQKGSEYYQSYSRKSMATQAYFTGRGVHESTQALRLREEKRNQSNPASSGPQSAPPPPPDGVRKTGYFERPVPSEALPPTRSQEPPNRMRWGDKVFPLEGDLLRIGRAPQNEIVLRAAGISRFHAQIQRQESEWVLEDLDSTNGTHYGGRALEAPHKLRGGDIVYFCDQRVVFEV